MVFSALGCGGNEDGCDRRGRVVRQYVGSQPTLRRYNAVRDFSEVAFAHPNGEAGVWHDTWQLRGFGVELEEFSGGCGFFFLTSVYNTLTQEKYKYNNKKKLMEDEMKCKLSFFYYFFYLQDLRNGNKKR